MKKVPNAALKGDMFYLRPLSSVPSVPDAPWFYSTPVGRNTLSKMLATMCEEAGIVGRKTNHSLRATAATELFHDGIAEKVIQDRTGHRSLEGLRRYERVPDEQKQEACRALMNEKILSVSDVPFTTTVSHHSSYHVSTTIQQQTPSLSFGTATMSGCTINIYQGPTVVKQSDEVSDFT